MQLLEDTQQKMAEYRDLAAEVANSLHRHEAKYEPLKDATDEKSAARMQVRPQFSWRLRRLRRWSEN